MTHHVSARSLQVSFAPVAIPDVFPTTHDKRGVSPVADQRLCEGCYAFAICQALTDALMQKNAGVYADPQDILQVYNDAFEGCNGGQIAGPEVERFLAERGVSVQKDDELCDGTCHPRGEAGSEELLSLNSLCHSRPLMFRQQCKDAFYFLSCCWRKEADSVVRTNWVSVNDEERLMGLFVHNELVSCAMALGFTETFERGRWEGLAQPATSNLTLPGTDRRLVFRDAYTPLAADRAKPVYYHAVTALGWLTLTEAAAPGRSGRYWIVRNSWSSEWGTDGFALVAAASLRPTDRRYVRNEGVVGGDSIMFAGAPHKDVVLHAGAPVSSHSTATLRKTWWRKMSMALVFAVCLLSVIVYSLCVF